MKNNEKNEFSKAKIAEALNLIADKVKSDVSKIDLEQIELAEKISNTNNLELIRNNAELLYNAFIKPIVSESENNYPLVSDIKNNYFIDPNCQATNNLYNLPKTLKSQSRSIADVEIEYDDALIAQYPKEYELNGIDCFVMMAVISLYYSSGESITHISVNQICKTLMNIKGKLRKSELKEKEIKHSIKKLSLTSLKYTPTTNEYDNFKDAFDEIKECLYEYVPLLDLNKAKLRTKNYEIVDGYRLKSPPILYMIAKVYNQNISAKKFLELNPKCTSIGERALLFHLYKRIEEMKTCSNIIRLDTLNNVFPTLTPRKIREKTKEFLQEFKQKKLITDFTENKTKQSGKITGYTFYPIGYFINKKEVSNERL